jgi:A/G-specific adenine glycosylase
VPLDALVPDWPDGAQRDRAIASLVTDGLAVEVEGALRLPS